MLRALIKLILDRSGRCQFVQMVTICLTIFVIPAVAQQGISRKAVEALINNRRLGVDRDKVDVEQTQKKLDGLNASLFDQQKQEIESYLKFIFKAEIGDRDPYEFAREKSRNNLSRLIKNQHDVQSSIEFKLAKRMVSRGLHRFRHNMVEPPESMEDIPMWLSSKQIEDLGLYGGLQGSRGGWGFNKDFLHTQNWIFFFVNQLNDTTYGNHEMFVDGQYAAEHGFIFPFVMYIQELAAVGNYMNDEAGLRFRKLFDSLYIRTRDGTAELERDMGRALTESERISLWADGTWRDNSTTWEFFKKHIDIFEAFRTSLAHYMFTVDDYRTLVATKVAAYLIASRGQNKVRYARDMGILVSSGWTGASRYFADQLIAKVLEQARLPVRYEMRVPVAIPAKFITLGNSCHAALGGN